MRLTVLVRVGEQYRRLHPVASAEAETYQDAKAALAQAVREFATELETGDHYDKVLYS